MRVKHWIVSLAFVAGIAFIGVRLWQDRPPEPVCSGAAAGGLTVVVLSPTARDEWAPVRCRDMGEVAGRALAWWVAEFPDRERWLREAWGDRPVEIHDKPIPMANHEKGAAGMLEPLDLVVQLAWRDPTGEALLWARVLSALGHELGHLGAAFTLTQSDLDAAVLWAIARQEKCRAEAATPEDADRCPGPDKWSPEHDWFAMRGYPW